MSIVRIGTASWTDPTLLKSGWYPPGIDTAEERLRYYAARFNIVEVDSTYYALPAERTANLWAERTPGGFLFNIKAFSLFTQHPTQVTALPKDMRQKLPAQEEKTSIYARDVPEELTRELWNRFSPALEPLRQSGKLGAMLFQFPFWFMPAEKSFDYILSCRERLPGDRLAIEFRNSRWMNEQNRESTLRFLRDNGLIYVCVDEPQGFRSSVPPVVAATADISLVRMHGRNRETWEKKGLSTAEKYNYLYSDEELKGWLPGFEALSSQTSQTYIIFNNCYRDNAVRNAQSLANMLLQQPELFRGAASATQDQGKGPEQGNSAKNIARQSPLL